MYQYFLSGFDSRHQIQYAALIKIIGVLLFLAVNLNTAYLEQFKKNRKKEYTISQI